MGDRAHELALRFLTFLGKRDRREYDRMSFPI